jgi:hypothetical protein
MARALFFLALLVLFAFASIHAAVKPVTVSGDDYTAIITLNTTGYGINGGLPQYSFYMKENSTVIYAFKLQGMWETVNGTLTKDASSYYEPSTGWVFGAKSTSNDVTSFDLQTDDAIQHFDYLKLSNRFMTSHGNDSGEFPIGKFDITLDGWTWNSDDARLVIAFQIFANGAGVPAEGAPLKPLGSKTVDILEAYFSINTTATDMGDDGNRTIDVQFYRAMDVDDTVTNPNLVYIVYDHFDGALYHDPEFGFGKGPNSSHFWLVFAIVVILIVIFAGIAVFLVAVYLIRRRRRQAYAAL